MASKKKDMSLNRKDVIVQLFTERMMEVVYLSSLISWRIVHWIEQFYNMQVFKEKFAEMFCLKMKNNIDLQLNFSSIHTVDDLAASHRHVWYNHFSLSETFTLPFKDIWGWFSDPVGYIASFRDFKQDIASKWGYSVFWVLFVNPRCGKMEWFLSPWSKSAFTIHNALPSWIPVCTGFIQKWL